ncbi:MAG: 2,3,4,5-tetrahydropyridine-2,6-dicarboxylate N-succinyltransferase [Actinobacteria bacterium]|jgi:2,3,4,5-tetrahydropyridine-2-carboxylate N-succinyltransferase|nr:2,3,4,5-tetrahydropyridine-2,6-dicarboxylate N-succinyltransferase [Actinomycetota bacterium]
MNSTQKLAYGFGVATENQSGQTLDCYFYSLGLGSKPENNQINNFKSQVGEDSVRKVKKVLVEIIIDLANAPKDVADVYLRLHLLSHRLVKPHAVNLEGIFAILPNVVWTSAGPCAIENFEQVRSGLQNKYGNLTVFAVDKFPRMIDYVIPEGVRIADGDRVRLGAYLSSGTTVMHEGFVNFNAGTLGKSMVEGRISAGVVVGDGSDIGGGASIMGTLSGGGKEIISIGERTLLGANSGVGISLGNDCVVEAGIYVTAGSKISLPDGQVVKAKELSGANNLLFRRNSQSGALEAIAKTGNWDGLNSVLHKN